MMCFFSAGPGLFQRPGKGGNGLASAGGNGQGIDPVFLILPHLDAALEDLTPLPVQIILRMEEPLFLQGRKEPVMELFQGGKTAPFHRSLLHIVFRIQKIPIHQTGIQHPQPKTAPNEIHLPLDLEILDDLFDSLDLNRHFQFLPPRRAIRNRFFQPGCKSVFSWQISICSQIRQPRMVPGNTESFHSRSEISIFCQKLGPRRRMVHPAMFLPQKILLEIPRVLPNIVEQPALPGRLLHFRSGSKLLRQPGHLPEMVQQELRWPFPRWIQMGQIWFSIHHHLLQLHPLPSVPFTISYLVGKKTP